METSCSWSGLEKSMEDEDLTLDRNLVFSSSSDVSKPKNPTLVPGPDAITISMRK